MKIVDRKAFLAMPPGTLFSKYEPCCFHGLAIKDETWGNDFLAQEITDSVAINSGEGTAEIFEVLEDSRLNGASFRLDLDSLGRDGFYNQDQLFSVWEPEDVDVLIARLQRARAGK